MTRCNDANKADKPVSKSENTGKGHPNKNLTTPHPVSGKRSRKLFRCPSDAFAA